ARGWHQDLDRIHDWQLAQPADQPLLLAGDFNASHSHPAFPTMLDRLTAAPSHPACGTMLDGLTDPHRATGGGWVRTWPQGRRIPPFVQLDHVLGRGVTAVDARLTAVPGAAPASVRLAGNM